MFCKHHPTPVSRWFPLTITIDPYLADTVEGQLLIQELSHDQR